MSNGNRSDNEFAFATQFDEPEKKTFEKYYIVPWLIF